MSAPLYYGPGARERALGDARSLGRLLCPPLGWQDIEGRKSKKPLAIDEARQLVQLLNSTPVGSQIGVVVIEAIDRAENKSSDVLLKSLEDYDPKRVVPFLWAFDLYEVRDTVRSRCHAIFAPGEEVHLDLSGAGDLLLLGRTGEAILQLQSLQGREIEILQGLAAYFVQQEAWDWWERIRPATANPKPTWLDLLLALMGGGA